jgi:hypothetical protein
VTRNAGDYKRARVALLNYQQRFAAAGTLLIII